MSTGKRLAKRSIIGTRVCAKWADGMFYSGVIQAVKTPPDSNRVLKESNANSDTRYSVRFDGVDFPSPRIVKELADYELIGPGFRTVHGCEFIKGQKVYLTFNGRETSGVVESHRSDIDEVVVAILPPGHEKEMLLKKKLEEVRLLESRKSARLMDQDTDFARLADMAGDRKRTSSHSIDVPSTQGSRKRRPSSSYEEKEAEGMNECTAALVLMSLSCSPHSPNITGRSWGEQLSPSPSSDVWSWYSRGRSPTPSPPLSEGGSSSSFWTVNTTDEGIVIDESFDDLPRKKRPSRTVFRCTWPGCCIIATTCHMIERHVRDRHLGPKDSSSEDMSDHEEEFYYTEVEQPMVVSTTPPVHPHKDMCRPPHEDPEYRGTKMGIQTSMSTPTANTPWCSITQNSQKVPKGSNTSLPYSFPSDWASLPASAPTKLGKSPNSPTRKGRGDTKKCRKVYGMEHREQWCTQCKWKKACTRFGD